MVDQVLSWFGCLGVSPSKASSSSSSASSKRRPGNDCSVIGMVLDASGNVLAMEEDSVAENSGVSFETWSSIIISESVFSFISQHPPRMSD